MTIRFKYDIPVEIIPMVPASAFSSLTRSLSYKLQVVHGSIHQIFKKQCL